MAQMQAQAAYAEAMAAQQNTGAQGWSQGGPPPPGYPTDVPYGAQQAYPGYPAQNGQAPYPAAYTYPTYGATNGDATCGAQPVYGYPAPVQPGQQQPTFQNVDLTQAGAAANTQNQSGGGKV